MNLFTAFTIYIHFCRVERASLALEMYFPHSVNAQSPKQFFSFNGYQIIESNMRRVPWRLSNNFNKTLHIAPFHI